jgi:hypothetical protein
MEVDPMSTNKLPRGIAVFDIAFATVAGGTDVTTGGTAAAWENSASSAFDTNYGTRWASNNSGPQFICYQFTSPQAIRQARFQAIDTYYERSPHAGIVTYSNNASVHTVAWPFSGLTYSAASTATTGNPHNFG